jgi:hypothetical protein
MLGMLICLREEYFKSRKVTWDDVRDYGLEPVQVNEEAPTSISPKLQQINTFSELITNLRHAFAHNCFEFIGNPITILKVWNIPSREKDTPKNRTWQAELSEEQLRKIAYLLIGFLEREHGHELAKNAT